MAGADGPYFIGVDVGTSSVRAALVSSSGRLVCSASSAITIWEPEPNFYEQSSSDIWQACCTVVRMVTERIDVSLISGIAFDATCSLVVLDKHFMPVSVSPTGDQRCNVVMWMDHRAASEASAINDTQHPVLRSVGGSISLEMQLPKLLWLKKNLEECWSVAEHFLDLPDFLSWRATGDLSRSMCSLVCKWLYEANESKPGWNADFLRDIGLADLAADDFRKIGMEVKLPGQPCGAGLTTTAADDLGLKAGLPVAVSSIDAHAGTLGCLSCHPSDNDSVKEVPLGHRLVMICGTSTCHIMVTEKPMFVPGVWGPYYSVVVPEFWTNEGGQSLAGKLLEHVISSHPAYTWIKDEAESKKTHMYAVLSEILDFIARRDQVESPATLTHDFHVWPDYHGNRSPLADPTTCGMVCGIRLSTGAEDLAVQYLATLQALAYGTRHIIDTMRQAGQKVELVVMCGGLAKNKLYVQTHADILGLPVLIPDNEESVLLGSAILAACASQEFPNIQAAMSAMSGKGRLVWPQSHLAQFHSSKYAVFHLMLQHQRLYRQTMEATETDSVHSTTHISANS